MLRYTASRLPHINTQLLWNTLFESFGVHARILYDFLRNEKDSRNFKASDFVDRFECGEIESIRGLMEKLRQQLLHLGKRRYRDGEHKLNVENAMKIKEWIEKGLAKFTKELGEPYRNHWNPDDADPTKEDPNITMAGAPTQSSHPFAVKSEPDLITSTDSSRSITYTGYRKPNSNEKG